MKIGISSLITIPEFAYSFATLKITLVKLMTAVIFPWISADLLNFVTNFGLKKRNQMIIKSNVSFLRTSLEKVFAFNVLITYLSTDLALFSRTSIQDTLIL